ncbi:MAG: phosphopyruvate hydratase [Planctomycetaceae bacterium]|nr:phosphopyruvate hydratase [Planctomycetaceae bacterium]
MPARRPTAPTQITAVVAREVLDSRGRPTVEAEVHCGKVRGWAIAPSGASTGRHEAHELRDTDERRYQGQGVLGAVSHVRKMLAPAVVGLDAADQQAIDFALCETDGTPDKSRCGANAILAVSLAAAHAAAAVAGIPLARHMHELLRRALLTQKSREAPAMSLPLPMVNMISGGKHAGGQLDFQDYLMVPVGATSYSEALEWTVRVYAALGRELRNAGYEGTLVGDEGGYGPRLPDNETALLYLTGAIEAVGFEPGRDVAIALDVAATHFYADGEYRLKSEGGRTLSAAGMVDRLADWVARYPIVSIEDGLAEDDWDGWQLLTRTLGEQIQLLGDDLFTTNVALIEQGIERQAANSVLIKLNQIGTVWETLLALAVCHKAKYRPVVSARSGESEDASIADLAVGTGAGQIKIGSVARSERLAKYNRLLRLEEWLGAEASFAGGEIVTPLSRVKPRTRRA